MLAKFRLQRRIRLSLIVALTASLIFSAYYTYASYQNSKVSYIEVVGYKTYNLAYLSTGAIIKKNHLYNTTYLTKQPFYFEKLIKVFYIYITPSTSGYTKAHYDVIINVPGVYTKLINSTNVLLNSTNQVLSIPLNISYILNLTNTINSEIGVFVYPPSIQVNIEMISNASTIYPIVFINESNGILTAQIINNTVSFPILQKVVNKFDPSLFYFLGVPSLGGISFIMLLTKSEKIEEHSLKNFRRFYKKYRKIIVEVYDGIDSRKMIEVGNVKDLVKYSLLNSKPIFVRKYIDKAEAWVSDGENVYIYHFNQS